MKRLRINTLTEITNCGSCLLTLQDLAITTVENKQFIRENIPSMMLLPLYVARFIQLMFSEEDINNTQPKLWSKEEDEEDGIASVHIITLEDSWYLYELSFFF